MAQSAPVIGEGSLSLQPLESSPSLYELRVSDVDWEKAAPLELIWMTQVMLVVRHFEEVLLNLKDQGAIHGPVHTSIGQEAIAAATASALTGTDKITGTHRAHHQFLGKLLGAFRPPEFNALEQGLTPEMKLGIRKLLSEVMGLADGCCGGRGGSMRGGGDGCGGGDGGGGGAGGGGGGGGAGGGAIGHRRRDRHRDRHVIGLLITNQVVLFIMMIMMIVIVVADLSVPALFEHLLNLLRLIVSEWRKLFRARAR